MDANTSSPVPRAAPICDGHHAPRPRFAGRGVADPAEVTRSPPRRCSDDTETDPRSSAGGSFVARESLAAPCVALSPSREDVDFARELLAVTCVTVPPPREDLFSPGSFSRHREKFSPRREKISSRPEASRATARSSRPAARSSLLCPGATRATARSSPPAARRSLLARKLLAPPREALAPPREDLFLARELLAPPREVLPRREKISSRPEASRATARSSPPPREVLFFAREPLAAQCVTPSARREELLSPWEPLAARRVPLDATNHDAYRREIQPSRPNGRSSGRAIDAPRARWRAGRSSPASPHHDLPKVALASWSTSEVGFFRSLRR
jgi:hypothetical protein